MDSRGDRRAGEALMPAPSLRVGLDGLVLVVEAVGAVIIFLGALATIRTTLTYFLAREIRDEQRHGPSARRDAETARRG
jgi:Protein of unknown function (DUF1622)